ncbi:hypothetical protein [Sinorhizobium meliloti]|uniref:hypothetical protein n=1 Tax=Rhizobium meliloti TaxID=382 RepID=UPI003F18D3A6
MDALCPFVKGRGALEPADGWIVARGSTQQEVDSHVYVTNNAVMYQKAKTDGWSKNLSRKRLRRLITHKCTTNPFREDECVIGGATRVPA